MCFVIRDSLNNTKLCYQGASRLRGPSSSKRIRWHGGYLGISCCEDACLCCVYVYVCWVCVQESKCPWRPGVSGAGVTDDCEQLHMGHWELGPQQDQYLCHCSIPVWPQPACTLLSLLSAILTVLARFISWHKFSYNKCPSFREYYFLGVLTHLSKIQRIQ